MCVCVSVYGKQTSNIWIQQQEATLNIRSTCYKKLDNPLSTKIAFEDSLNVLYLFSNKHSLISSNNSTLLRNMHETH